MAEKLKIPNQVIDSDWKDDVDVDYAIYGENEKEEAGYEEPAKISKDAINKIKNFRLTKISFNTGLRKFRMSQNHKLAA